MQDYFINRMLLMIIYKKQLIYFKSYKIKKDMSTDSSFDFLVF